MRRLIYDMFYADEISEDVAYKLIDKLNKIRDKTKYSWERKLARTTRAGRGMKEILKKRRCLSHRKYVTKRMAELQNEIFKMLWQLE